MVKILYISSIFSGVQCFSAVLGGTWHNSYRDYFFLPPTTNHRSSCVRRACIQPPAAADSRQHKSRQSLPAPNENCTCCAACCAACPKLCAVIVLGAMQNSTAELASSAVSVECRLSIVVVVAPSFVTVVRKRTS